MILLNPLNRLALLPGKKVRRNIAKSCLNVNWKIRFFNDGNYESALVKQRLGCDRFAVGLTGENNMLAKKKT